MATKKFFKGIAIFASSAILSMSTMQSASAAPGNLAQAPLFLSTLVEPNVFFNLDDSGSMDWNPIFVDGTAGVANNPGTGVPIIDGDDRAYYNPSFTRLYTSRGYLPPYGVTVASAAEQARWDRSWVVRNHIANRNYYNPAVTYLPWAGSKSDGSPMYQDADPTAALKDPYRPASGNVDLTVRQDWAGYTGVYYIPTYFIWPDTEADGQIDQADAKTRVEILAGDAEMQNFANWFVYYRSRSNAAKSIIGTTINNTDASRMGMSFFNNTIARVDVETMSDPALKRTLLDKLYSLLIPSRGTPARQSMHAVGNYFDNTGSGAPILSAANGGECQQNFNILMSDGFWNSNTSPGVGNADNNGGSQSTPFDGTAAQSNDGGNYADGNSETLADVAMYDYERDLRGDLADNVPYQTNPGQTIYAEHQHLETYTIAFGKIGTLDPSAVSPLSAGFVWPNPLPGANSLEKIDDMWHAAYNGRGQFLSAGDPEELQLSLNTAIADIAEKTATAAAVSINSAKLTTQSVVYLAQFNTNRWQGNLFAFKIADLTTGALSPTAEWDAASVLNSRNVAADPRTILTSDGVKGVPFRWADLSVDHKADLNTNPGGGTDADVIGMARLDYMRGDRSNEGTGYGFRTRLSVLSDLVNSGPVFVGKPGLRWPDKAPFPTTSPNRYSDFKIDAATRAGMVYAGSNGGMMHGFAEATGEEKIAYIPNNLFSTGSGAGLHYLTDQNYGHRYYNDLTPTVTDVYADLGGGQKWQTVLISGQRGGGRGIFALDITEPADFVEANADKIALWEFTNAEFPDLGYTYSRPQIALTNESTPRWVAIFGNGYNDTGDGEAKLFIVDIAGFKDGSWDSGDYVVITTNSGTNTNRNGLATPALADLDGNGTVDMIYAGDLNGQMWSFDLSGDVSAWTASGASLLFTTKNNEPITTKPTLSRHPTVSSTGSNDPNIMVFFGSGQYLVSADKTSTNLNYFYGVWDNGTTSLDETRLVEQVYDPSFTERVLTRRTVNYAGGDFGWFFELPDKGERSVTNAVVRGSLVFFNTFVPETDPCSVGGYGYRFAVNQVDGGSPDDASADTNGDGIVDDNDKANDGSGNTATIAAIRQEGFLPEPVFIEDIAYTAEIPTKVEQLDPPPKGRFGWQELIQ